LCFAAVAANAASPLPLADCRITAGAGFPGIKARCGSLSRPENPADPNSPEIELHVAVVPALDLDPEPDPFVPLAGGPGQGAIQFYSAYRAAFETVRRDRDILLVDQRGTGSSARMDCAIDDDIIEGDYSIEQTLEATRDCLDALPHDPVYFTTSVAVTDLEAVRTALGYDKLNLYGSSYGSRVAQHFARRYPMATRTIVLDGVVPPQIPLGSEIASEAQRAIDTIFARCAADAACSGRFPEIDRAFILLTEMLDVGPVAVELPDPVTGRRETIEFGRAELAAAVRLLAYRPSTIALLPLLVHEGANGNLVPLAAQLQLTVSSVGDTLALGMHNTVMCTEDIPFIDYDAIDYEALKSTYIGAFQLEALEAICSLWPDGPLDPGFREPLATDVPVLLLSGDADPITPPRYAELAAVDLTRARHLIGERQGHGLASAGCMPSIIAEFVATANPDSIDADCLSHAFAMPFFLDYSGPTP
jgi:pimeloyl-ACP methyl ester carboxylesterase